MAFIKDEGMGKKSWAKFDKTFMAFGSIMNGVQSIVTEKNWRNIVEMAFMTATVLTSRLVDASYGDDHSDEEGYAKSKDVARDSAEHDAGQD